MTIARFCLLLIVFLIPLLGARSGVTSLAVLAVLMAGGWIGWAASHPRMAAGPLPLRWPLLSLSIVTLLSLFTSVYRPASMQGLLQIVTVAGIVLLAGTLQLERRHLLIGAAAFGLGVLCGTMYGLLGWFTWQQSTGMLNWRVQGAWENANFFAAFLLLVLPILAVMSAYAPKNIWRVVGWITVALSLLALVLTQSRGGLLAFLLAVLFFAPAWLWATKRLTARGVGMLALAFVLLIGVGLASPVGKRVLDPDLRAKQFHSQMFRVYTWQGAWAMVAHYPWLGAGPNTFPSAYGKFDIAGYTRHAHQIYLQTAAELGLPGLLALCWLFSAVIAVGVRGLRGAARAELPEEEKTHRILLCLALLAGAGGLFLHGLMDSDWIYPGIQLALLLQAVLVWRITATPKAQPSPAWRAVLIPAVSVMASVILMIGARAEQLMAEGETSIDEMRITTDKFQQYHLAGKAAGAFEQAVTLAPQNAAYLRRASLLMPPDQAQILLKRAIEVEPTNSANYLFWARFLLRQGKRDEAIKAFADALAQQPHNFPAQYSLAQAHWAGKDASAARKSVKAILDTIGTPLDIYHPIEVPEPWYPLAWYAEGVLAQSAGEKGRAEQAFEEAITASDHYLAPSGAEAEAWSQMMGTGDDAIRVKLVSALAHLNLAGIIGQSNPEKAAAHLKAVPTDLNMKPEMQENPFP